LYKQPIIDQFQAYHTKIETMAEIKTHIAKNIEDDPATVAEVQEKLEQVQQPFDQLHSKVINRQARLQNVVIRGQDYQLSLEEAKAKLSEMEKILDEQEPVSAKYVVAAEQKLDHEVRNTL
jgi:Txe/YoeB family toxin of Txe-Axe toxin-antitoxin module